MGISHKQYDVKGVQFHPESVLTEFGLKIIENWLNS
jgi:anthranilate synthase component II